VLNNDVKRLLSATWRWTPGPTFTNELNGGFNLAPATFANSTDFAQDPVFTGFNFTNPNVTFRNQGRDTDTYNIQNNASWTKGTHFLRFGYASQFIRVLSFNEAGVNPGYTVGFASTNTLGLANSDRLAGSTTTCPTSLVSPAAAAVAFTDPSCLFRGGISAADLGRANALLASLAGFVSTGSQSYFRNSTTSGFVPFAPSSTPLKLDTHAGYVSDSWRVRPSLTFNYGLRWEYVGRFDIKNGIYILPVIPPGSTAVDTILSNATLDFAGGPTGRPLYNSDMNNFGPNVGIAWDVRGNGKTAIRAGYSVHFVNDEAIRSADNAATGNQGGAITVGAAGGTLAFATTRISGTLPTFPVPSTVNVPRLASENNFQFGGGSPTFPGLPQTIFSIDPDIRTPYVQEWNFGIQHEVGWNTVVDMHYTGNKGTKLYRGIDFNQVIIGSNGFLADFLRARAHEQVMENPWSHVSTIEIEGTAPASDGGRPEASGGQWLESWLVAQPALIRELYERRVVHGESQRQAAAALNLSRRQVRTLEADLQRSILRVMGQRDPELAERLKRKMPPKRSAQSRR